MGELSRDAIITLLLYLVGAPALLIQSADSSVRYVLTHPLRPVLISRAVIPAIVGAIIALLGILAGDLNDSVQAATWAGDLVLLGLFALVIFVSIFSLPISRKRTVVKLMREKILRQVSPQGMIDEDDLRALTILGSESDSGEEKRWTIKALTEITRAVLDLRVYAGCHLESIIESLRKVILEGSKTGSPENFQSAIEMLRLVINSYDRNIKKNPSFSDADLDYSYKLLAEMGKEAMKFPLEGVASACIGALGSYDALSPAASQRLSEVGSVAIDRNRMGVAMAALHILEWSINSRQTPGDDEIVYDYIGLLGSFWSHGESAQKLVKQHLDQLKHSSALRKLVGDSIQHHTLVSRFRVADHIRAMWDGYQRLA